MALEFPEAFLKKFDKQYYYHTWTIPTCTTDKLYSIEFSEPRVDDAKWNISLKLNKYAAVFNIKLISEDSPSFIAKIDLHVNLALGCIKESKTFYFSQFESGYNFQFSPERNFPTFKFSFEAHFKIALLGEVLAIPPRRPIISKKESFLACTEVFQTLVDDPTHSDVTLVSKEGMEIRAHKAILAARSPVFSAMFSHDMEEKRSSVIKIEEYDHETLKYFVTFIYTGFLPPSAFSTSIAKLLFAAADKYDIPSLRSMTEEFLIKGIKKENVIDLLVISELFHSKVLQKSVIKYLLDKKYKFAGFFENEEWKTMLSNYPMLKKEFEATSNINYKCGYSISE